MLREEEEKRAGVERRRGAVREHSPGIRARGTVRLGTFKRRAVELLL